METQLEILESEASKLAPGERAALAQRLLASIDEETPLALGESRKGAAFSGLGPS